MRNICMVISYDGSAYQGFQTQPHHNTIQDKIEKSIAHLTGERLKVFGSGRTDAGVHAKRQVINFYTNSSIPVERWPLALNSRLPKDIAAWRAIEVPDSFHARHSASRKTYRYSIYCAHIPDVFRRHMHYFHPRKLNAEAMNKAASYLLGKHDFSAFGAAKSDTVSTIRTIFAAAVETKISSLPTEGEMVGKSPETIVFSITGNGFLYHMVRNIIGTLIQIGEGRRDFEEMPVILHSGKRSSAGPTAPPQGLMLWDVQYDGYERYF